MCALEISSVLAKHEEMDLSIGTVMDDQNTFVSLVPVQDRPQDSRIGSIPCVNPCVIQPALNF